MLQMEELKPYNEASKAQRAERTNFDSRWSDLDFKNEQQLDEVIASIDYRLSHETNSVADEKKLIAELKKLGVGPSPLTKAYTAMSSFGPEHYHEILTASLCIRKHLVKWH